MNSWLQEEKSRLGEDLEARRQEVTERVVEILRLDALVKSLSRRLDEMGVAHAQEELKFNDMEALRQHAGVYAPLGTLPRVPVLATLQHAIGEQFQEIQSIEQNRVGSMKTVLNVDEFIETRLPEEIEALVAQAAAQAAAAATAAEDAC